MYIKLLIIMIFVPIFFASCYTDKEDLLYGNIECNTENVSFNNDILPIIKTRCATSGCHVQGGSGLGIFENYNQIKSKVDNNSLARRVLELKDMPPSSPLTACQIEYFRTWIEAGAINN